MSAGGYLESVLARVVPDRVPAEIERIETGNRKRTYRVTFTEGPTLAVQCVPSDRERLVTEGVLLCAIADRTSVPVPPVVAYGVLDEGSYLLTEWVGGPSLHERFVALDSPGRHATARALGGHLAALHEGFEFDAFGPLAATHGSTAGIGGADAAVDGARLTVTAPVSDWRRDFCGLVEEGLDAFRGPLTDLVPPVRAAIESIESLPRVPVPRLFPWDYRPGNVLVRGGEDERGGIATILDFESPRSAHREFSLAKTEYLLADWYDADFPNSTRGESGDSAAVEPIVSAGGVHSEAIRAAFYAGYETRLPIAAGYWRERRRVYRLGAISRAAFDSGGVVTRPGYPMVDPERAVRFHREHLQALL